MSLPTVAPADFKARYPVFASVGDVVVGLALEEARGAVSEAWIPTDVKAAMLAYTAHLLVREGALGELDPLATNGGFGSLQSMKAGDHEIRFSNSGAAATASRGATLQSTPFGLRYLELCRRSFPAVLVV